MYTAYINVVIMTREFDLGISIINLDKVLGNRTKLSPIALGGLESVSDASDACA